MYENKFWVNVYRLYNSSSIVERNQVQCNIQRVRNNNSNKTNWMSSFAAILYHWYNLSCSLNYVVLYRAVIAYTCEESNKVRCVTWNHLHALDVSILSAPNQVVTTIIVYTLIKCRWWNQQWLSSMRAVKIPCNKCCIGSWHSSLHQWLNVSPSVNHRRKPMTWTSTRIFYAIT